MDQLKKWVTLSVALSMLLLAAGWFLLVSPKRSEAADLRLQAQEQVSANSLLETQLQVLKAQAKDLPKEQARLAAVAAKIPGDPALPGLVRALLEAATSSGVELVSVSPGAPALATVAAPAVVEAPVEGQTTPDPAAAVPPAADPATAVPPTAGGPAGLLANIPVVVSVNGDYFEVQQFVAALEGLPRALRVQDLALTPGTSPTQQGDVVLEEGRFLNAQITGFVFMAADRLAPVPATVPTATAATDGTTATTATPAS